MNDNTRTQPAEEVFDRAQMRLDTIEASQTGTTQMGLWDRSLTGYKMWEDRARAAAAFVPPGSRVLDIGCGDMAVERFLPEGCVYLPLDVVARDERTMVIDLNRQRLPAIEADFVIGLGVLEYIYDLPALFRQLARQIPQGLFTYYPLNESIERDRLSLCWVNALNTPELLVILRASGYRGVKTRRYKPSLNFYSVTRSAPSAGE
jgi:hypothetical protein